MAPMQENNAKRRGRPAGSTSFQRVKLSDLNYNCGQNAMVTVSKKWLELIGFVEEDKDDLAIDDSSEGMIITATTTEDPEEKIQFEIS